MRLLKERRIRAPEIAAPGWAAGAPQPLEALRGRVVLLDFFSFADPAGISALGHLRLLQDHYRSAGLFVIGVHVPAYAFERPAEAARQEVWRLGIPYPVALDGDHEVFRAYEGQDLPARYVVDAAGFVRGWHNGPGGLPETERAVRALLREAQPDRELPHVVELLPGMPGPGGLEWLPSPEIRFGTRGVGLPSHEPGQGEPPREGESREFGELPQLRAQGHPYLEGRWTLRREGIVSDGEDGAVAVVFEGASVAAVLSVEAGPARLDVTLDGGAPPASEAGADLEEEGGRLFLPLEHGRLYDLVSATDFGVHNLDLRVHGRGVALHLLHFGSSEVPGEA